jgi:hypothetical protein
MLDNAAPVLVSCFMSKFDQVKRCAALAIIFASANISPLGGADSKSLTVRINNGLVPAPAGIAFVVNDQAAFALNVGCVVDSENQFPGNEWNAKRLATRPGMAAPDDSTHKLTLTGKSRIQWDWGRVGDAAVGRLKVDAPTTLTLKLLKETWPGFVTSYTATSNGASGSASLNDGQKVIWRLEMSPVPATNDGEIIQINADANTPVRLVAGFGKLPKLTQVDAILERAEKKYEARRPAASGAWGDFAGAIADNMNNSRIYSSDNKLLVHSVSRRWANDPNTAPYFCWDSAFNGALACLDDPATAKETVRALLRAQSATGLVPNFSHVWNGSGPFKSSEDRSQPPVGALCVWKIQQRWPDKAFLAEVYPKLKKWHAWWLTDRDGKHDGLLEWGSNQELRTGNTPAWQAALYETGWDDTPHFDGARMAGNTMNAYAVDLNALWAMDAEYLALIAGALGQKKDAAMFRSEQKEMNQRINDILWNEKLGMYCSRLWVDDGKPGAFLTRFTPMNFYPLICGAPDADRAAQVMKVLKDPARFWGKWKLPTLAYNDPLWPSQVYWRGDVWAPVNYLVFQGVKRYASPEEQQELARAGVELFMRNWNQRGVCGENFLSSNGEQSSDSHYTWGALLCLIGVESIVDMSNDGQIIAGKRLPVDLELRNIPLGGKLYHVTVKDGQAVVKLENRK